MSSLSNNHGSNQSFVGGENFIYSLDLNGNLTFLNRYGEQLLGYSRQEARQLNIAQLIVTEIQGALRDQILSSATKNIGSVYEIEVIAKDGRRVPLEVSTSLVFRIRESSQTARAFPDSHRVHQNA